MMDIKELEEKPYAPLAAHSQQNYKDDSMPVISERALREIYLKAFEMCVKEGAAKVIMTSYNPINEYRTAVNLNFH